MADTALERYDGQRYGIEPQCLDVVENQVRQGDVPYLGEQHLDFGRNLHADGVVSLDVMELLLQRVQMALQLLYLDLIVFVDILKNQAVEAIDIYLVVRVVPLRNRQDDIFQPELGQPALDGQDRVLGDFRAN